MRTATMARTAKKDTLQRGAIRRSSPTPNELADLKRVIEVIAARSGADEPGQSDAFSQLVEAIHDFRMHYPFAKGNYKRRGAVADHREALGRLSKSLRASLAAAESLPYTSKIVFSRRIGSPLGKVTKLLDEWAFAASKEYTTAQKREDKPADDAPAVLAFDVARTLSSVLRTKLTMTSDRNTSGSSRGGAAYCRLLRATMFAAGDEPPSDLVPLMKQGMSLLDDFRLDAE